MSKRKVSAQKIPPPCPRCLPLAWNGLIRREIVQPLPECPPLSMENNEPCCYDCASADALVKLFNRPDHGGSVLTASRWKALSRAPSDTDGFDFLMARICVGNDRQEQYRLPGAPMGLVYHKLVRPSAPGDLDRHLDWLHASAILIGE